MRRVRKVKAIVTSARGKDILDDDDIVEIRPDELGNAENQELYNGVNETG